MNINRRLLIAILLSSTVYLCHGQWEVTIDSFKRSNIHSKADIDLYYFQLFTPNATQSQNLGERSDFNMKLDSIVTWINPLSAHPEFLIKQRFLYDDQGVHTTTINYTWLSVLNGWEPTFKDEYFYDPEGRPIERYRKKWEEELQIFEDFHKMEYHYLSDQLERIDIYSFQFPSNWKHYLRHFFLYDEIGKVNTEVIYAYQENDLWFGQLKKDFVYGDDGNVKRVILKEVDPVLLQWENRWENNFIFEDGNLIEEEIYSWSQNLGFWLESEITYFEYNSMIPSDEIAFPISLFSSKNKVERRENFLWDLEEDDFTLAKVSEYFYSDIGVGMDELSSLKDIEIFPNPVLHTFFIQAPFEKGKISIVQLNGTVVKELSFIRNQTIDISFLPAGAYFVIISDRQTRSIQSIIKM